MKQLKILSLEATAIVSTPYAKDYITFLPRGASSGISMDHREHRQVHRRFTWTESTEMISPPSRLHRRSDNADFPTAVGPISHMQIQENELRRRLIIMDSVSDKTGDPHTRYDQVSSPLITITRGLSGVSSALVDIENRRVRQGRGWKGATKQHDLWLRTLRMNPSTVTAVCSTPDSPAGFMRTLHGRATTLHQIEVKRAGRDLWIF